MAKEHGVDALMGLLKTNNGRFDECLSGLQITSIEKGLVKGQIVVEEKVQNAWETMHGGAICALIDVMGTIALLSVDPTKAGVSVELNCSFVAAAPAGETVYAEGRTFKVGRTLGFTEVTLKTSTGKMIATGRHTKAFSNM